MIVFRKYGDIVFAIALLLHCLFIYIGMSEARTISKLTLIPILILFLTVNAGKSSVLVYLGLVFSFLGDLLLAFTGQIYFLLGMLAFIGTHISNGFFFAGMQKNRLGKGTTTYIAFFLLLVFSVTVFIQLKPSLGSFELPILCYMCIICLMAVLATGMVQNPLYKVLAIKLIIPGAVFFVLSDTILAFNKFMFHQPLLDMVVMLTYGLAQYLLVKGFVEISLIRGK